MKVLYIGYYKENSDWGKLTSNNILALDSAGVDVACRAISLGVDRQISGRLEELEKKSIDDCDLCIQHVFPDNMVGSNKFKKNIAIFGNSFVELEHTTSVEKLELADEVWVPSACSAEYLGSILNKPCKYVPFACQIDDYTKPYQNIEIPQAQNQFKFYSFVDPSDAKALDTTLSCFHSEFDSSEGVALILLSTSNMDGAKDKIDNVSLDVKRALGLQKDPSMYIRDIIITESNLTESNLYEMHQYGDCFLSLGGGDPWSPHVLDAMAFGSTPIATAWGGTKSFLKDNGTLVSGSFQCRKTTKETRSESNLGKDYLLLPCHRETRLAMRNAYNNWLENPIKHAKDSRVKGLERAKEFSLQNVGKIMKERLENAEN
jgi:glycosyltransferase involved in cell wall biosynthesis